MSKLWGGRFRVPTARAVEAFTTSLPFDRRLLPYDVLGSIAHARMLARQGVLTVEEGETLVAGLVQVYEETGADGVSVDPQWEDVHSLVEARLRERVGEVAGKLHTARSRNDQIALDVRLYARDQLAREVAAIAGLQTALLDVAARHQSAVMPGYTHLQRAQPILLAHHLLAHVEMLQRDAERLQDCFKRTNRLPLGAGALAGVPYPIDRSYVASLLAFDEVLHNSVDAVADRDFVGEHLAALSILMAHLSRLAEELVLWSTAEFGYIEIGEGYATGSSIMPQKKNPDVAELVRAKAGRVYGALIGVLTVLKGLPLAYNRDLQEDKEGFFDANDTALASLHVLADALGSVEVHEERMRAAAGADFALATDYADYLARKGLPFRDAHHVVGAMVRHCLDAGKDLTDLTLEELRGFSPLFEADALKISVESAVAARDVEGGTAPGRVAAGLARGRALAEANARWAEDLLRRFPTVHTLAAKR